MRNLRALTLFLLIGCFMLAVVPAGAAGQDVDEKLLESMFKISSEDLYEYVRELASDKYEGRLTGTEGYNASAEWLYSNLEKWGVSPAGDNGTFLQAFKIPYTLIYPDCRLSMDLPYKDMTIKKSYSYYDEFIPGSTSGSGEVTAEVVYVGYGATAPELGYDDYKGVDVKGKIVLVEREVPVSPEQNPEEFLKWRPYSLHQY